MASELTDRQTEVLAAIVRNMTLAGPTFRELMPILAIKSPNGIQCHLDALKKKGVIVRDEMKSRGIRLRDPALADGLRIDVGGTAFILVPADNFDG